jgi:hypothetical protein
MAHSVIEHRVGDRRIIRLIQKWLKAGVLEDGIVSVSDESCSLKRLKAGLSSTMSAA